MWACVSCLCSRHVQFAQKYVVYFMKLYLKKNFFIVKQKNHQCDGKCGRFINLDLTFG